MPDTPLLNALKQDNFAKAIYLIDTQNINPNEIDPDTGKTPLHLALKKSPKIASMLLEDPQINVLHPDHQGKVPLHIAAKQGNPLVLKKLLNHLQKINDNTENQRNGVATSLHHKDHINIVDKHGNTPLLNAIFHENLEDIQILLEHNADPDFPLNKLPLNEAIIDNNQSAAIMMLLLAHRANPNVSNKKAPPLVTAVLKGDKWSIKMLLDHKANPNFIDKEDNTALHRALQQLSLETSSETVETLLGIVETLLEYGANPNLKNQKGDSPLHIATQNNNSLEAVKLLLKYKADPNLPDKEGNIAIFKAIDNKNLEMVGALLPYYTGPSIFNDQILIRSFIGAFMQRNLSITSLIYAVLPEALHQALHHQKFTPSDSVNEALTKVINKHVNNLQAQRSIVQYLIPVLQDYHCSTLLKTVKTLLDADYQKGSSVLEILPPREITPPMLFVIAIAESNKVQPSLTLSEKQLIFFKDQEANKKLHHSITLAIKTENLGALNMLLAWQIQANMRPFLPPIDLIESKLASPHFKVLTQQLKHIPSLFDLCLSTIFTHISTSKGLKESITPHLDIKTHAKGSFIEKEMIRRENQELYLSKLTLT